MMPLKPLYINSTKPVRVLLDGRGLRVRQCGVADRLFPLNRLSRVMLSGRVELATDALLACASENIPIHFIRRDGLLRARILGATPKYDWMCLQALFYEFLAQTNGLENYRRWIDARQAQRKADGACIVEQYMGSDVMDALSNGLDLATKYARRADLKYFDARLLALVKMLIDDQLNKISFDPDAPELLVHDMQLVNDLSGVIVCMQWQCRYEFVRKQYNAYRKRYPGLARLGWCESIRFLESHRARIEREIAALLRDLFAFVGKNVNCHVEQ